MSEEGDRRAWEAEEERKREAYRAWEAEEERKRAAYRPWEDEEERKRREAEPPYQESAAAESEQPRYEGRADQPQVEPLAITVGATIPAATTIDALFTALYATRSADLVAAGTPTYSWAKDNMIIAQWPALQVGATPSVPNYSAMFATFHARGVRGSSIAQ